MKLGVSITAFREKDIVPIIQQFEGIADKIIVSVSKRPWYGELEGDDTAHRALEDTSACIIQKAWDTEEQQRNETMSYMRDMDYVIVSHCDTWFTRDDLEKLKAMELTDLHYGCEVKTYWKDSRMVITPPLGLPTILVRSDAVFEHLINIQNQEADPQVLPITCYHTSWIKTDKEVLDKIRSYSHADEIAKGWYQDVWLNWKDTMTNFGPTNPADFQTVQIDPLPIEIYKRLI